MADTARSIVTTALQWNKSYSPSEPILDSDAELALDQLNAMLDSWSTGESLSCPAILEQSVLLTVNKASYSIGLTGGADIALIRPIRIIEGPGAAYVQDTNHQNYDVDVVTRDKWNQIGYRDATSNVPDTLFYDSQFPLGVIHLFPVPNIGYTLYFDSYQQLGSFATLNTAFSLPPGYKAAVTSNLSVWLKPFFKSAVIDPDLMRTARTTKKNIQRANRRTPIANLDPALISRPQASYNIYTDRAG